MNYNISKVLLCLLLISILPFFTSISQDNTLGQLLKKAEILKREGDYQKALKIYKKALKTQQKSPKNLDIEAEILLRMAVMYGNTLLGNKVKNLEYLEKAEETIQKTDNNLLKCKVATQLGLYYEVDENYRKAQHYYQEAFNFAKKGKIEAEVVYAKLHLAIIKLLRGDYHLAIDYFQSLTDELKGTPNRSRFLAVLYNNLASCYDKLKEYEKASQMQKKALDYNIDFFKKANHPAVLMYYTNLAGHYVNSGKFKEGQKELDTFFEYTNENTSIYRLTTAYKLQANIFTQQKKYDKSLELLEKARKLYAENYGVKNYDVAHAYQLIAENYLAQEKFDKALKNIQKSFISNHQTFKDNNWLVNPKNNKIIVEDYQLELLYTKIKICLEAFEKTKNNKYLNQADKVSKLALDYIDLMRQKHSTEKTILFVGEKANEIYQKAMQTSFVLWEKSQDKTYIEQAFMIAEKSKSYQLMRSLNEQELRQSYEGNQLVNKEVELTEKITLLRSETEQLEQDSLPDKTKVEKNQQELTKLQEKREKLLTKIEKEMPEYYQNKFALKYIPLKEVQENLASNENVLAYFVGETALFSLVIQQDKVHFLRKKLSQNWKKQVLDFRKAILEKDFEKYSNLAYQLYKLCFDAKVKLKEKLLIISDNILHYVPLECLINQKAQKNDNYKTLSYLLKKHLIHYHYSATLAFQEKVKRSSNTKKIELLAFAPEFSDKKENTELLAKREITRDDLTALPSAKKEVKMLKNYFEGKTFLGKKANKQNFEKFGKNSKVIHLATHAIIDDKNTSLSRLLFDQSKGKTQSDLYAYEINNMYLDADLVTLSACNTGFGSIQKGEGVMSLSRSFMNAGAKSVVMSLWAVSDESTSDLMQLFYKNLNAGLSKDLALQKAKIQYIENTDQNGANPYYWASFVLIGDEEVLTNRQTSYWLYWLLGIPIIIILIFLLRRRFTK